MPLALLMLQGNYPTFTQADGVKFMYANIIMKLLMLFIVNVLWDASAWIILPWLVRSLFNNSLLIRATGVRSHLNFFSQHLLSSIDCSIHVVRGAI